VTYGGDSGNMICVLYWRCSLIRVSVIRGSTVVGWVGPRAGLDRCGKSRPHRDFFFFLYSLLLCSYFIRICCFVLIALHFAFLMYLQHEHPCPCRVSNPQTQQAIGRRPSPTTARPLGSAGIRSPDRSARGESLYRLSYPGPPHEH
jgi:hypothetical protein